LLKILIVDDEVLERKVLTKMINDSSKRAMVIGEAPNGRIAIEMAKEYHPDVVFMDIKMPGIDGVQAVKEIRKLDPGIRFIMVSAFNTFEYAKEVMQQGVKEYILKPSSKKDILESLERVTEEILEERKQKEEYLHLRENLNRAVSIAQQEWISSLLVNQVQDITFDEWGQLLGVEITCGYIVLFSFQPIEGTELTSLEKEAWYTWLKETIKLVVKDKESMFGPMKDKQVPVLLLSQKTLEKSQFITSAKKNIEQIFFLFQKESFKGQLKIGIGRPYHHAHELHLSYHEAVMALEKLLKVPSQRYLFAEKQEVTDNKVNLRLLEMEKKLLDAVRQGDLNSSLLMFDLYIKKVTLNKDNGNDTSLKKVLDELFILLSRMLHDLGISYPYIPALEEMNDDHMLLEKGKSQLFSVVQHVQGWRNNHAKGMLYKAKEYIESHFAETLTLEQVAEYVELSPFYFSKLFKDRFGMNFIDYLTDIRISKAKEEMSNQGKSLKEICYSIGYKDPNYFSRVFKKITGLSPTEYRKRIESKVL
jgi:two-component system, response regulator YesN